METLMDALDGSNDMWALDLDDDGNPIRAHRITRVENTLPGFPEKEIRWTACGERRSPETHPRGWWLCSKGQLPLGLASANHCGVRKVDI